MSGIEKNLSSPLKENLLLEPCPKCGDVLDMHGIQIFTRVVCPTCGAEFLARARIDRFQLLDQLAEGGTACVYRALETNCHRVVALKIIKDDAEPVVKENHERQARSIAALDHPNVVQIFDIGTFHGHFYLGMEFLNGGSLDDLIEKNGVVDEATVLEIGIEVGKGLEAALSHGLIHRDIKPANILFTDSRAVKLVDFGLSAQSDGEIWGTPNYIAPEKLEEQPEDFRSDIYSLGATLFHALIGRPPFETDNVPLAKLRILKRQIIDLKAHAPCLSEGVVHAIERMMAVDPARRHSSYWDLLENLQRTLDLMRRAAH